MLTHIPNPTMLTPDWVRSKLKPRPADAHKGTFGHALLIAGGRGTVGAALLAGRACLRSGVGLLTIHAPQCAYVPLQTVLPEAMVSTDAGADYWQNLGQDMPSMDKFTAIGVGCGIGQTALTQRALSALCDALTATPKPAIFDADALNVLAQTPALLERLPQHTVLTPHPKEFAQLVRHLDWSLDSEAQTQQAHLDFACRYRLIVVLKGHRTRIATDDGQVFVNPTGNAGMAKGGSGDTLTGIILALLAQGYAPDIAACLGVYIHGAAGDLAAKKYGKMAMLPSDLIESLGSAFSNTQTQAD